MWYRITTITQTARGRGAFNIASAEWQLEDFIADVQVEVLLLLYNVVSHLIAFCFHGNWVSVALVLQGVGKSSSRTEPCWEAE